MATTLSAADLDYLDPTDCYLQTLAARPVPGAINYELYSKSSSSSVYNQKAQGEFCPVATLGVDLPQEVTSTAFYHSDVDIDLVEVGSYAYIDDEVGLITAINTATQSLTLTRGVMDTVPAQHSAGAIIWFVDGAQGVDPTEYAEGETVNARMLTVTGKGTLALNAAPTDSLTMTRRQNRPYPPGNLRVNYVRYPAVVKNNLTVIWAHRDRLSQTVNLISQATGNIGPESDVTYALKIYGETGNLQRTLTDLATTNHTYTLADDAADSGLGRPNDKLRIELESNRLGIVSWQRHSVEFERAGYGLHYDKYYGGI